MMRKLNKLLLVYAGEKIQALERDATRDDSLRPVEIQHSFAVITEVYNQYERRIVPSPTLICGDPADSGCTLRVAWLVYFAIVPYEHN